MKKGLLRVKQRADQGLGRAEKTEVLSEDLLNAEKKVEVLKQVLQNTVKKISASLQAHNVHDVDKRLKKMPIEHLATAFSENSAHLAEGMLSAVFKQCFMGLNSLGSAQVTYELTVESSILCYFQDLLDKDIPMIKKSKQQLSKLTLDMDAARSRQQSAAHSTSQSSHNKTEALNNELEEAEHKVATCKDQYTTEMFTFLSKESDIGQKIIEWTAAQVSLYRTSLTHLEDTLRELKCMTELHATRPVYGCPLEEHLQSSSREIALVIETCISVLYHDGLEEEGLFRIAGSSSKLKKLKAAFNVGNLMDMEEYYTDYHVVAGALKLYIRELPEPLLTYDLYEEFIQCMSVKDWDTKLKQMWTTIRKLPESNLANVKYLVKFLAKLAEKSDVNKMTPSNISIVFGPNLLSPPNKDPGTDVVLSAVQNHVVETLILQHDYFFPGDIEFADVESISSSGGSPTAALQSMSSFGQSSTPNSADRKDDNANSKNIKQHPESVASTPSLSNSQLSISSIESSGPSVGHSPSFYRKSKKPAPPPPPTNLPQMGKETSIKPDRSETKPNEHVALRKPSIPPPGPPVKPITRPTNAPPPKPTVPPHPQLETNSTNNQTSSTNPFEDEPETESHNQSAFVAPTRSLSDSATSHQDTKVKMHTRNASAADINVDRSPSPDVKGHNRAKSHDFKLRHPPPIPQRTNSIPAKHSPDRKCLPVAPSHQKQPSSDSNSNQPIDIGSTAGVSSELSNDVIIENANEPLDCDVANREDLEYRDRMNSQSDATTL